MAYIFSQKITANHIYATAAGGFTNFPVCINLLNRQEFKSAANGGHVKNITTQASGPAVLMPADLIFTSDSAGATKLSWEVQYYDPVFGTLIAWVRLPTFSGSVDTTFYVFYGDAAVTTPQNTLTSAPTTVWDSHYVGVYHTPNGLTLNSSDSTIFANNGTVIGGVTAVPGQLIGAAQGDGATGIISLGNSSSLTPSTALSITCWTNMSVLPAGGTTGQLVAKDKNGGNLRAYALYITPVSAQGWITLSVYKNGDVGTVSQESVSLGIPVPINQWTHLGGTYRFVSDGTSVATLYHNGVIAIGGSTTAVGPLQATTNNTLLLERDFNTDHGFFNGAIGEVRISNIERSNNWIAAEYDNQLNPISVSPGGSDFINTFGPEVAFGIPGSIDAIILSIKVPNAILM